jgi:hypothetical protein
MRPKFDVILLGEVWDLLDNIDEKSKDGYSGSFCATDFGVVCASDFGSNCATG